MKIASERKQPIPVYAEMSSINPVILFPNALQNNAEAIGKSFASSLTLGAGQFCTNPGLIIAIDGPGLDAFLNAASAALQESLSSNDAHRGDMRGLSEGCRQTVGLVFRIAAGDGKAGNAATGSGGPL